MFCIYTQVSRVWIAGNADGHAKPGKTSALTICMPRQPETRTGKKPLHRKSTRNSRNTWLKTLSGAGAGVAGVAGGFCLYFVFEMIKITGLSAGDGALPTGQNRHLKKVYKPVVLAAMTILFPLWPGLASTNLGIAYNRKRAKASPTCWAVWSTPATVSLIAWRLRSFSRIATRSERSD